MWVAAAAFVTAACGWRLSAKEPSAADAKWEPEIQKFEAADRASPPPKGAVLFVGSSSFRLWATLAEDFSGIPVINRGFGGSEMEYLVRYADRIILPYGPRAVVVYAGDNDLAKGKAPERVLAEYRALVEKIRAAMPDVPIGFVAVKASIKRWPMADKIRSLNAAVAEYSAGQKGLFFVDVFTPMLGADGTPRKELFVKDGLHLSREGYALWAALIRSEMMGFLCVGRMSHGAEDISGLLSPIRERHGMPGMAGAIVTSGGLEAVGWCGVRKRGAAAPVTGDDLWHLGSCTKAMTATLVGLLVEKGKLRWDSTVSEIFPRMAGDFHEGFRPVTVAQVLSHRAGLPENLKWGRFSGEDGIPKKRLAVLREAFGSAPSYGPGSKTQYSNVGYVIAGAAIENVTGDAWEKIIREWLFVPLGMGSAGFGGLGTPGEIDQPWGHRADGAPVPKNGSANDNVPVMGPAGRVHCTIQDWAKFVADQLRGARGRDGVLKAATYRELQEPGRTDDKAKGWLVLERPWGGGRVLHHAGSNTMNYANVWIAPARDFAVMVCVNQGGDAAFKATDEAVGALIGRIGQRAKVKGQNHR